jgi:hypothetical protein
MKRESDDRTAPYRVERGGYAFLLPAAEVAVLRRLPDFETEGEPAVGDEFLRFRAERWADNLSDAGAEPGTIDVRIDSTSAGRSSSGRQASSPPRSDGAQKLRIDRIVRSIARKA